MPLCFRLSTFNYWILGNTPLVLSFSFSHLFISLSNHLWSIAALLHHCFFSCFLASSFLSGCHPGEPVLHCGGATCICGLVMVAVIGSVASTPQSEIFAATDLNNPAPPSSLQHVHLTK